MILILFVIAGIMSFSRELMLKASAEAESCAREAETRKGPEPEDLIRLCQFIDLWIPGMN